MTLDEYRQRVVDELGQHYNVVLALGDVFQKPPDRVTLALMPTAFDPARVQHQMDVGMEMRIYLPMAASLASSCNILAFLHAWCIRQPGAVPIEKPRIRFVGIDRQHAATEHVMMWSQRLVDEPCDTPPELVLIRQVNIEVVDQFDDVLIPIPEG